jgi:hypothetical protein
MTGRPFGGVAFLWQKAIADNVKKVSNDDEGRCLASSVHTRSYALLLIAVISLLRLAHYIKKL